MHYISLPGLSGLLQPDQLVWNFHLPFSNDRVRRVNRQYGIKFCPSIYLHIFSVKTNSNIKYNSSPIMILRSCHPNYLYLLFPSLISSTTILPWSTTSLHWRNTRPWGLIATWPSWTQSFFPQQKRKEYYGSHLTSFMVQNQTLGINILTFSFIPKPHWVWILRVVFWGNE